MTATVKNTLKSVIALSAIALVCVSILAVANALFPKPVAKLDMPTVKILNTLCPTGVSDDEALSGGYFSLLTADELPQNLAEFNKANGSTVYDTKVNAVYKAVKGAFNGRYIVEAQSKGYNPTIVMMTAYDENFAISATRVKSHGENAPSGTQIFDVPGFYDYFVGKTGSITQGDLTTSTGASQAESAKGVTRVINISAKYATLIKDMGGNK